MLFLGFTNESCISQYFMSTVHPVTLCNATGLWNILLLSADEFSSTVVFAILRARHFPKQLVEAKDFKVLYPLLKCCSGIQYQ